MQSGASQREEKSGMISSVNFLLVLNASLVGHLGAFQPSISPDRHSIRSDVLCWRSKLYASPQVENVDGVKIMQEVETNNRLLTPEQNEFFDSLDMQIYGGAFIERLRDLQEYKNKHGTCHVPKRYAENPTLGELYCKALIFRPTYPSIFPDVSHLISFYTYPTYCISSKTTGNWVNKSRQMYRKRVEGEANSMTPERIQILNKMGFIWLGMSLDQNTLGNGDGSPTAPMFCQQSRDRLWNNTYDQLKEYVKENGSTISLSSSTKLGVWAARQRREYQKLKLGEKAGITQKRVDLLNSINFDWTPWDTKWQMRVNELLEYKRGHGDCLVSIQYCEF